MKKFKSILITLLGSFLLLGINEKPLQANAVGDIYHNSPTDGVHLDYIAGKGSEDFAHVRYAPQSAHTPEHLIENPWGFIFGFDDASGLIETITGIGFRVTVRNTNDLQDFGNWLVGVFGGAPTFGELETFDYWVSSSSNGYLDSEREFSFPFIGLVEDLKETETNFYNKYPSYAGSAFRDENLKDFKLSNSIRSIAKRRFYSIIPIRNLVEGQYETFDAYRFDGTFISSGTDNGKPFENEEGEMFIDIEGGTDFAFAVNGSNAKLVRVEVLSFPSSSLKLLIENGSWNYEKQQTEYVKNRVQLINDNSKELNWDITNDNRYVFMKYAGSIEALNDVKLRFYYSNDNGKASFIIRAMDKDGNLLPPAINVEPEGWEVPDLFTQLQMILSIIFAIIVIYLFIKLIILIFQLIGSGRNAFRKRK